MVNNSDGVNLLPTLTKKEIKGEQKKGRLILGTAGITLLVSLTTVGLLIYNLFLRYKVQGTPLEILKINGLDSQIADTNDQIDSKEDILVLYSEVGTKIDFVDEILTSRPDYQQILDRIQDLLPDDIVITKYEISAANEIKLEGLSKDYYTLALFISRSQKEDLVEGYLDNFSLENAFTKGEVVSFKVVATAVFSEREVVK